MGAVTEHSKSFRITRWDSAFQSLKRLLQKTDSPVPPSLGQNVSDRVSLCQLVGALQVNVLAPSCEFPKTS